MPEPFGVEEEAVLLEVLAWGRSGWPEWDSSDVAHWECSVCLGFQVPWHEAFPAKFVARLRDSDPCCTPRPARRGSDARRSNPGRH